MTPAHGTLSARVAPPNPRAARSSTVPGRAGPRERRARWHEAPARARPKSSSGARRLAVRSVCGARARETRRGDATLSKFPHRIRGFPGFPISSRTKRVLRRSVLQARARHRRPVSGRISTRPRDSASPSSESRGAANTRALHCCTRRRRLSAHGSDTTFYPVAKSKDDRAVEGPLLRPFGPLVQAGVGADRRRQLRKRV